MLQDRLGHPDQADKEFKAALSLGPRNPDVLNNYAVYLCRSGRADEGVKAFEEAAHNALYRTPEAAYTNAGVCLRGAKRDTQAAMSFQKALQVKPNFAEAAYQLADLDFRRGEIQSSPRDGRSVHRRLRADTGPAVARRADRPQAGRPDGGREVRAQAAHGFPVLRPDSGAGRAQSQLRLIPMAVEAGGIGARLRAGREKLGLTVLQVAERIHTDPKIVEAIEAENFEALGAPVYARGHIRHYADLVGESANELTQIYSNLSKVAQPDLTRIVKAPARPESNKLVAPALVVIAVFAVAGAIWWISALSKKKPQMSETHVVTDEAPASPDASAAADGAPASRCRWRAQLMRRRRP